MPTLWPPAVSTKVCSASLRRCSLYTERQGATWSCTAPTLNNGTRMLARFTGTPPLRHSLVYGLAVGSILALLYWLVRDARLVTWVAAGIGVTFLGLALAGAVFTDSAITFSAQGVMKLFGTGAWGGRK